MMARFSPLLERYVIKVAILSSSVERQGFFYVGCWKKVEKKEPMKVILTKVNLWMYWAEYN